MPMLEPLNPDGVVFSDKAWMEDVDLCCHAQACLDAGEQPPAGTTEYAVNIPGNRISIVFQAIDAHAFWLKVVQWQPSDATKAIRYNRGRTMFAALCYCGPDAPEPDFPVSEPGDWRELLLATKPENCTPIPAGPPKGGDGGGELVPA